MRGFLAISWKDRALLAEAGLLLALARIAVLILPFRVMAPRLGEPMAESDSADDPDRVELGRRIGWAIRVVSSRVPWRTKCLEQALAAKAMLRMRRVPNTMYLGVARGGDGGSALGGHAWVRTGTLHVTGGAHVGHYTVLSTFADRGEPRRSARST